MRTRAVAFLLATPVILAAGVLKVPSLCGLGRRTYSRSDCRRRHRHRYHGLSVGALPGPLLRDPDPDAVRDLLRVVAGGVSLLRFAVFFRSKRRLREFVGVGIGALCNGNRCAVGGDCHKMHWGWYQLWYRTHRPICPMRPDRGTGGTHGTRRDAYGSRVRRLGAERSQVQILSPRFVLPRGVPAPVPKGLSLLEGVGTFVGLL